jgi:hypothetical protein
MNEFSGYNADHEQAMRVYCRSLPEDHRRRYAAIESLKIGYALRLPPVYTACDEPVHSLSPDYLARLRLDARQLATLRALGEYRGKQRLYFAQSPEVLGDLRHTRLATRRPAGAPAILEFL